MKEKTREETGQTKEGGGKKEKRERWRERWRQKETKVATELELEMNISVVQ